MNKSLLYEINKIKLKQFNKQLSEWINDCEEQSEFFKDNGMEISSISSEAMAQAYKNVQKYIKLNKIK